ncbi:MAG: PTS system mannose/fructose/N-acetylgalactosamine-transporter subunit IIB [Anaerolineaceae bacterium]|jgi:PTS system mannose-specific IIB component
MPVTHVRMDNRLIHGQILVSWNSHLKIDHLIVTNDKVASDPLQVTLLKAVTPIGGKVSILTIQDCVNYCLSSEAEKENIFIITKFPEDGLALVENGLQLPILNLGNQAFVRNSKKLSNSVFLTESGVRALKAIHEKGIKITCRMMPTDPESEFWPVIEKNFPEWVK